MRHTAETIAAAADAAHADARRRGIPSNLFDGAPAQSADDTATTPTPATPATRPATIYPHTAARVVFIANDKGNPPGKLADAEIHFDGGPFDGLRLVGFGVWQRSTGGRNVTFPARQYSINGERRSFALLRPVTDTTKQDALRDLILEEYRQQEAIDAQSQS